MPDPPIFLKSTLPEHRDVVQLERWVTVQGNDTRRRVNAPSIADELDPEMACRVFAEFEDYSGATQLNLSTGALKFEFWRKVLKGVARDFWDSVIGAGRNLNDFAAAIEAWFEKYMEPTAYHDQKQYFIAAKKPFTLSCQQTASRLRQITTWMSYMPGHPPAGTDHYDATELKMVYYNLMRENWKSRFDAAGHAITTDAYTMKQLVSYMASQEREETRLRGGRQPGRGRGSPGRGYARGGRGGYHSGRFNGNHSYRGGYMQQGRFSPRGYRGGYGGRYQAGRTYSPYGYNSYGRGSSNYQPTYNGSPSGGRYQGSPATGGRGFGRGFPRGGRGRSPYGGRGRFGGRQQHAPQAPSPRTLHQDGSYNVEQQQPDETKDDTADQAQPYQDQYYDHYYAGEQAYDEPQEHWVHDQFAVMEGDLEYEDAHNGYGDY